MVSREITPVVRERLATFPAVAIVGARQVGKTTLAREIAGSENYYDLELAEERTRLDVQWEQVSKAPNPVVLDEAQAFAEVFPRLRATIDDDRGRKGRFLILGSISPSLMRRVSESLAGRIALCELKPFSLAEVGADRLDELWLWGGYPDGGVLGDETGPQWAANYLDLLAMRDLPDWGLPAKPAMTKRMFAMLAAIHGGVWNASGIGRSLGLSYHTINSYLDYLEQAFLVRRVPAWSANIKKRLVKSPKIYWRDSGLLHALLRVRDFDSLLIHPRVGNDFEGFVIEQTLARLENLGIALDGPYFLRTSDGKEIDLVIGVGSRLLAVEVKLSSAPDVGDLRRLEAAAGLIGADVCALVSRTVRPAYSDTAWSCDLSGFLDRLADLAGK